ncbi:MAG: tRNA (N6-isopentenyl adenosine(37)-C2)-methylthiotransferase MiaB [Flavobacteriales bacterium]|nr:tRNA (N6-isopentenyl adenosine(37)-C2)-methylthiotransferase MiaB [Flavobacteriales bacterium]MCC6938393.1 tRNA (N6-isopentenyl adenosine(37)-C2)-methylthiotransferase MiaB [Flavobacteriales bacterium]
MSKKVYIESYGCQMNFSDSEIVASVLVKDGYTPVKSAEEADLVLLNTCSIREKAEYTVLQRINEMNNLKARKKGLKVGVLGCMAERMREDLLEKKKVVDLVVGPDAYRTLPDLLSKVGTGQKAVNVLLSREETYGEIEPVRLDSNGVTAFVTIMRGCDNMCAFCVVPFTRGRERSRDPHTIVRECEQLVEQGYREVTLLGQNVDSFKWTSSPTPSPKEKGLSPAGISGERHSSPLLGRGAGGEVIDFADLLEMVALACPTMRIRYSTSHPKDMTDKVLVMMARYANICKYIHLPVQSGSSEVLNRMNRGYDRAWYLERMASIRRHMPECAISTDIITGFSGETEEDHQQTLSLMNEVVYDMAFMFKYSERPKTMAARKYADDVPEDVKGRRLAEIIETQKQKSAERMASYVGHIHEVLIEGVSKRSEENMYGRNSQNSVVILSRSFNGTELKPGTFVRIEIVRSTAGSLFGTVIQVLNEEPVAA